jgi:hypothetical protein
MRCPSAATGVYALECAMDELAVVLKVDPLELRLRCYSERDQNNDRPFSSAPKPPRSVWPFAFSPIERWHAGKRIAEKCCGKALLISQRIPTIAIC